MPASLRTGTALYASALLLDRLLGLLLLPLLTRAITPADYGAWAQTAVAAGFLMPLVLLATPTAIVRWFSGNLTSAVRRRGFTRLGAMALALAFAVTVVALVWREAFARLVYGADGRAALVPALLALLAADATVDFATAWLRAAGRMGWISTVLALRSLLRFGIVMWLVMPGGVALADWMGRYAAAQCALAFGVLVLSWRFVRVGPTDGGHPGDAAAGDPVTDATEPAAAAPALATILAFCWPLVALALFTAVGASFDRFLLVRLLGLEEVAVYAAVASLCGVTAMVYTVLGFTLFPVLARHWSGGRRDAVAQLTTQALLAYGFLALPLALTLALAGPALLPVLSTVHYRPPPTVFAGLALSVVSFGIYQILLYPLLLDGRSRQVLALTVAAAALNAVLNLLLAPSWGLAGAAAAAVVANAAIVPWAAWLTARALPWRFPWAELSRTAAHALVAATPLAWAARPWEAQAPSWPLVGAMALLAMAVYLALDRTRGASVARMLLPK